MLLKKLLEVHYTIRNYIFGPALKYMKISQANYLKISFVKNNHKTKFKLYIHISNQNINLKFINIKNDSKIYIYSEIVFY